MLNVKACEVGEKGKDECNRPDTDRIRDEGRERPEVNGAHRKGPPTPVCRGSFLLVERVASAARFALEQREATDAISLLSRVL